MYTTMFLIKLYFIKQLAIVLTVLNLVTYCLALLSFFSLFFLMNLNYLKSLSELKVYSQFNFYINVNVLIFLSLAGLPPFLGFFNKFFIFYYLLSDLSYLYFILFILLNFFSIYFYIQNLKSLISKDFEPAANYINNIACFNFAMTFLLILVQFVLIFGAFFISDFLIMLTPLNP